MKAIGLLLLLALLTGGSLSAQKCLQMERYGSLKKQRMYIGDEITFQLKNDDTGWHTRLIIDFDVDGGYIVCPRYRVHIDSISMIQLDKSNGMKFLGTIFLAGGANGIIFAITYPLFNDRPPEWSGVAWGAAIMGLGALLWSFDKKKKFKVGKKKRLRLLDLNFGPPVVPSRS